MKRKDIALTNFYVSLIQRGAKTIDDAPAHLRGHIEEKIAAAPIRVPEEWEMPDKEVEDTRLPDSQFIGNKDSKIVHIYTCSTLPGEKNSVFFECFDTVKQAIKDGFRGCKICNPV